MHKKTNLAVIEGIYLSLMGATVQKVLPIMRAPELLKIKVLAGRLFHRTCRLCRCRLCAAHTQELSDAIKRF